MFSPSAIEATPSLDSGLAEAISNETKKMPQSHFLQFLRNDLDTPENDLPRRLVYSDSRALPAVRSYVNQDLYTKLEFIKDYHYRMIEKDISLLGDLQSCDYNPNGKLLKRCIYLFIDSVPLFDRLNFFGRMGLQPPPPHSPGVIQSYDITRKEFETMLCWWFTTKTDQTDDALEDLKQDIRNFISRFVAQRALVY